MNKRILSLFAFVLTLFGCGAASDVTDLSNLIVNPPKREPIDQTKLGVQNFFTEQESFGSVSSQFQDISQNLHIHFVRILVPWLETLQSGPTAGYNFAQADAILKSIPAGVDVLVTLAHTPTWFADTSHWVNGNPRQTWVQNFLQPVVQHFKGTPGIIGWEIFNEPDAVTIPTDALLGIQDPSNYVDMLHMAHDAVKSIDGRLVVMAASQSIQQNWPTNFDYNQSMKDAGALDFTDVWNIHYYGTQFEKVVGNGNVADFLNDLGKPVWVTESGEMGPTNQLAYVQQVFPFLIDQIPAIDRTYYYEYASNVTPVSQNFGMRTTDSANPVSDLYVSLRDGTN